MRTTTEQNEPTASPVRRATLRLALATAVSSTAMVMAAEVAHARIALNHSEAVGRDHRTKIRRAAIRLAAATSVSATALVMAAEVAHARIALNHSEATGAEQP